MGAAAKCEIPFQFGYNGSAAACDYNGLDQHVGD
jgi:hypothetical protein